VFVRESNRKVDKAPFLSFSVTVCAAPSTEATSRSGRILAAMLARAWIGLLFIWLALSSLASALPRESAPQQGRAPAPRRPPQQNVLLIFVPVEVRQQRRDAFLCGSFCDGEGSASVLGICP